MSRPSAMIDPQLVSVHPEITSAIEGGRAVVALESAVLTSGLPRSPNPQAWARADAALAESDAWPQGPHASSPRTEPGSRAEGAHQTGADEAVNRLAALRMEEAVRAEGAVPALVAVVDGILRVGLDAAERDRLAADARAGKVSTATLAGALGAGGDSAGTTVSATLIACRLARIRTFATGGIGGVHRGWTNRPDISADLPEIARGGTTVVCAGAKSILDIAATIEALETLGVPVVGVGTDVFPRFHAGGDPGDRLAIRRDDPAAVAELARRHEQLQGRPAGVLAVRPVPRHAAMDDEVLRAATAESDRAADAAGVRGPARTPWVLEDLASRTAGASLAANLALLVANARLAGAIAVQQVRLVAETTSDRPPIGSA